MGNAFPWSIEGLTFRSRADLEKVIERFASAGTHQHLEAARVLAQKAVKQHKLSADQYTEIKERLHL